MADPRADDDHTEHKDTDVTESDPNGDSQAGLAGNMGVSSERVGSIRGNDEWATHGADPTESPDPEEILDANDGDVPPEQSADPATGPEPHPANDLPEHPFDPDTAQPHSHG